jgi:hypothetical protein
MEGLLSIEYRIQHCDRHCNREMKPLAMKQRATCRLFAKRAIEAEAEHARWIDPERYATLF